jgi:hypothetical protein
LVPFRSETWAHWADIAADPAAERPVRQAANGMNWEAIGAIGEVVGAAGVIASLVYLAVQIRQNTRSIRRASGRQSGEKNAVALRSLAEHAELFSGDFIGLDGLASLDRSQRTRFDMIFGMWMQAIEQTFADVREGLVESEYATPYRDYLRRLLSCPGGVQWWSERRAWFSASFQREVDHLIEHP